MKVIESAKNKTLRSLLRAVKTRNQTSQVLDLFAGLEATESGLYLCGSLLHLLNLLL